MPGWQDFVNRHPSLQFLSVSVDVQGGQVVKPYVEGTTFPTLVDTENVIAHHFGFKIVPNGIFIDEHGTIRLLKQGFRVTEPKHLSAIQKLLSDEVEHIELEDSYYNPNTNPSKLEQELAQTKFKLALEYLKQDRKDDSLRELDEALLLDPNNFLIRKQRWYIRHPEKFSPLIDIEWQQKQLEKERAKEVNDCGPEGCTIPGNNKQ